MFSHFWELNVLYLHCNAILTGFIYIYIWILLLFLQSLNELSIKYQTYSKSKKQTHSDKKFAFATSLPMWLPHLLDSPLQADHMPAVVVKSNFVWPDCNLQGVAAHVERHS